MLPRINLYYTKSRKSRIWIDLVKLALNSNIHAKFALWTIRCDKMWQAFSFPIISRKADLCIRGRFCCLFCNVPHHSFTDTLEQTATAAPSVSFEALSNSFPIASYNIFVFCHQHLLCRQSLENGFQIFPFSTTLVTLSHWMSPAAWGERFEYTKPPRNTEVPIVTEESCHWPSEHPRRLKL